MPGFSNDLNTRFFRPWLQKDLGGSGSLSLPQKRHLTVVNKSKTKSKKRKLTDHSKRKRSKIF